MGITTSINHQSDNPHKKSTLPESLNSQLVPHKAEKLTEINEAKQQFVTYLSNHVVSNGMCDKIAQHFINNIGKHNPDSLQKYPDSELQYPAENIRKQLSEEQRSEIFYQQFKHCSPLPRSVVPWRDELQIYFKSNDFNLDNIHSD